MKIKFLAEFIGTFLLIFLGTGAIIISEIQSDLISNFEICLIFATTIFAMIYLFGKISGAHLNPAVSLSFYFARKISKTEFFTFLIAQILGGILASFLLYSLYSQNENLGGTSPKYGVLLAFLIEFILSFVLMLTIVLISKYFKSNFLIAFLISLVIFLEAYFFGSISGASMNPIRSLAPALISGKLDYIWIYILAPSLGMVSVIFIVNKIKKLK